MELFFKYISVFLASMLKFILGPATGLISGLSMTETICLNVSGMMCSVLIFSFLGRKLKHRLLEKYYKPSKKKWAIKLSIWLNKHGVNGIAFLTPVIFSPIIGTLLASSFNTDRKKLFLVMLASAVFWAIILNFIFFKIKETVY